MKRVDIRILAFLGILFVALAIWNFVGFGKRIPSSEISNFEDCVAAGYPVMERYPEQCRAPDGKTFTRDIGNELEFSDEIIVDNPRPNQTITSPVTITGQARGSWYFEATFPIELVDENGNQVATSFATAQDEWMTEEFVPFTAEISFSIPKTKQGELLIRNANPSGLPENQKELALPIVFE
ncbi:Gmad2 immunoglobulin-like domain-containing protein [Candidatus Roizmanbacteria bacterium]|nr:Gmad2 immunoglobulin-like domain-containing protein [Candidatus Roizmanbacteria bacterium]